MTLAQDITCTTRTREQHFLDLYKDCFPAVAAFVASRKGTYDDAMDSFQDALIILFEKQRDGTVQAIESEEAYLVGIAKHLWLKKTGRQKSSIDLAEVPDLAVDSPGDISERRLLKFLERAGRKCMELLTAFYYEKKSAESLADEFGYNNAHSATVQKFKCLGKVRNAVAEKMMTYDDFME